MKLEEDAGGSKPMGRPYRSNTEETALILTSMSMGRIGAGSLSLDNSETSEPEGEGGIWRGRAGGYDSDFGKGKAHNTKFISIDELRKHFDRPIIEVAKEFGICITLMKKICRNNGIKRWPHRQIRSLSKSIASMEAAMITSVGAERAKYQEQIRQLKEKRNAVISDPNRDVASRKSGSRTGQVAVERTDQSQVVMNVLDRSDTLTLLDPEKENQVEIVQIPLPSQEMAAVATLPSRSATDSSPSVRAAKGGRWTSEEHAAFLEGIRIFGKDWRRVSQVVGTRSAVQTRTHAQKYLLKSSSSLAHVRMPGPSKESSRSRKDVKMAKFPEQQDVKLSHVTALGKLPVLVPHVSMPKGETRLNPEAMESLTAVVNPMNPMVRNQRPRSQTPSILRPHGVDKADKSCAIALPKVWKVQPLATSGQRGLVVATNIAPAATVSKTAIHKISSPRVHPIALPKSVGSIQSNGKHTVEKTVAALEQVTVKVERPVVVRSDRMEAGNTSETISAKCVDTPEARLSRTGNQDVPIRPNEKLPTPEYVHSNSAVSTVVAAACTLST